MDATNGSTERDLRRADALLERLPAVPALTPFERVSARAANDERPLAMLVAVAALVAFVTLLSLGRGDHPSTPASEADRPLDLGPGVALVAPAGDWIAVTDEASTRFADPSGVVLARTSVVLRYPRWLPDSSGLVGTIDRTGAGVDVRLPLAIVERDGRITPLGLDVPATSLAYLAVSADGRSVALQDGADVLVVDRGGAGARTLVGGTLVGWDAAGRVLVRDRATLFAVPAQGGARVLVGTTADIPARVESRTSPDGSAALVVGPGAAFVLQDDRLVALPAGVLPSPWLGGSELLGRGPGGQVVAIDVRTLGSRNLYAMLDDEAWSALRAVADGVVLWFRPAAGEAHLVDLATGGERIVGGLSATSTFQPLAGGRFLVTGRGATVILGR